MEVVAGAAHDVVVIGAGGNDVDAEIVPEAGHLGIGRTGGNTDGLARILDDRNGAAYLALGLFAENIVKLAKRTGKIARTEEKSVDVGIFDYLGEIVDGGDSLDLHKAAGLFVCLGYVRIHVVNAVVHGAERTKAAASRGRIHAKFHCRLGFLGGVYHGEENAVGAHFHDALYVVVIVHRNADYRGRAACVYVRL